MHATPDTCMLHQIHACSWPPRKKICPFSERPMISCRDTFAMSRVKANWRRIATWFDGFKKAGEGWAYLQSWENPGATIGTMAALSGICCFPHVMVSLALTGLVIFMVGHHLIANPLPEPSGTVVQHLEESQTC